MKFSWFPGHMKKALRQLESFVPLTDMVFFMLDSRVPQASINPELLKLASKKTICYLLNKSDLADPTITSQWVQYFRNRGDRALSIVANDNRATNAIFNEVEAVRATLLEKRGSKRILDSTIRIMVVGLPNSGKSTLINKIAGKVVVSTGKKPGLTRGIQWISLRKQIDMLDMPGIFYPRLESEEQAWHLAATGAAMDIAFPVDELAYEILLFMRDKSHEFVSDLDLTDVESALRTVAEKRNFILRGGKPDYDRAAAWSYTSFKDGKFGRFSLELP